MFGVCVKQLCFVLLVRGIVVEESLERSHYDARAFVFSD